MQRSRACVVGALLAGGLLAPPAVAAPFEVVTGLGTFVVTGFNLSSYATNSAQIEAQPWWGRPDIATAVADQMEADGRNIFVEFGVTFMVFATSENGVNVTAEQYSFTSNAGPTTTLDVGLTYNYALGYAVAVPEIDGGALAKALFILFALGAWLDARRRRAV